ncbi:hypothetical protein [Blastococcus tunisiensis]|uniref:hypothetical protein n=1 Tax=Blastococcus tunisiensis TaxID=1798228 RepID=UPI001113496C|nr:hypothetical protein [Blastococcus sp. DSM 46838]
MPPELTPPPPGSLTVPPLSGWQGIAVVLGLLVVLGITFLVVAAARSGSTERSEWQAWLDARSTRGQAPARPLGADGAARPRSASGRPGRSDGGVHGT